MLDPELGDPHSSSRFNLSSLSMALQHTIHLKLYLKWRWVVFISAVSEDSDTMNDEADSCVRVQAATNSHHINIIFSKTHSKSNELARLVGSEELQAEVSCSWLQSMNGEITRQL